jgi:MFS family permease
VTRHPGIVPKPAATLVATLVVTVIAMANYTAPLLTVPDLSQSFHTHLSAQAWLLNGTPLGLAAFLLIAGSFADDFGRRRLFLAGTLTLAVTAGLSALTTDTLLYTITRVAQGAASAAILTSSLGLIVHAFPHGHSRVRATGAWGATVSAGIALGPLLAAGLNHFGWRPLYAVIGIASLVTAGYASRVLTESRAPREGRPDVAGAAALGLAFTSLLTALTLGRDGWLKAPVLLLFAATVVLLGAFALVERRVMAPLIELSLLRHTPFLASIAGALFTGLSVLGFFSYFSTLAEQVMGTSVIEAAWLAVLWAGVAAVVALQARRIPARISGRHQLAIGFLLHAVGILAMLGAFASGSTLRVAPGVLVAGIGSGLLNAVLPRIAVESVPVQRAAMGSGASNTARYIGSSVGVVLTLVLVSSGRNPASGANTAVVVMAVGAVLGAALVLALRGKKQTV